MVFHTLPGSRQTWNLYYPLFCCQIQPSTRDLFDEPHVRITEWHSIHWLSLQKAVATIIKIYGPLVATLDNEAVHNAVAKVILSTAKFVLTSAVIVDVLKLVEPLNKLFQTRNANFSTIRPLVNTTIAGLRRLKCQCEQSEGDVFLKDHEEFQGVKLQFSSTVESDHSGLKIK